MSLNNEDLQQLGQLPQPQEDIYVPEMGDNGEKWSEMENVRLVHEGGYWFLQNRGGSNEISLMVSSPHGPMASGRYITVKQFTAYINGSKKQYVVLHKDSGRAYLWDTSGNYVDSMASGFSTTTPIQIVPTGKLVYLFDYEYGLSRVYDIEAQTTYDYLDYTPTRINSISWHRRDAIDPENIWGIKKGAPIYLLPGDGWVDKNLVDSVDFYPTSITATGRTRVFLYTYNGGIQVYYNGEYLDSTQYVVLPEGETWDTSNTTGSGDSVSIEEAYLPANIARREVELGPIPATITELLYAKTNRLSPQGEWIGFKVEADGYWLPEKYGNMVFFDSYTYYHNENGFFPLTHDILDVKDSKGKYEIDFSTGGQGTEPHVQIASDWNDSERLRLNKSYMVVDILYDGSATVPGRPVTITTGGYGIFDVTSGDYRDAITLDVPAATTGISKRFLCATRFQGTAEKTLKPSSPEYPNSPFFIVEELPVGATVYTDRKKDTELSRPISELFGQAMDAGVPAIFGANQIEPNVVTRFQGVTALGGYKINRPVPYIYIKDDTFLDDIRGNVEFNVGGISYSDRYVGIQYRYDDGTYSPLISEWAANGNPVLLGMDNNYLYIHGLNALVRSVDIIVYDSTAVAYYKTHTIPIDSALAHGAAITITGTTLTDDAEIISDPTQREIKTTVYADSWFIVATFPQQLDIGKQRRIADQSSISHLLPLRYDGDKSTLRFQMLAFTDNNIQLGYYTERDGESYADFEVVSEHASLKNAHSVYRTHVGETILYQSRDGISMFNSKQGIQLAVDMRKYPELSGRDVTGIWYWSEWDEYWIAFGYERVIVLNMSDQYVRSMRYPDPVYTGVDVQGVHYVSTETLLETDLKNEWDDYGSDVVGKLLSKPIGGDHNEIRLWDATIYGSNGEAALDIDLNPASQRGNSSVWTPLFNPTISYSGLKLDMHGVRKMIRKVATKPQFSVSVVKNDYFYISSIKLRYIPLQNLR